MNKLSSAAKIDPELWAHIQAAADPSTPIAAVVKLRAADPKRSRLQPQETGRVTEKVLDRVRKKLGEKEQDYLVLDMFGAFNLVAPARFVCEVLKQPEIASAFSPEGEESAYIPPRNVKEVHLKVKS